MDTKWNAQPEVCRFLNEVAEKFGFGHNFRGLNGTSRRSNAKYALALLRRDISAMLLSRLRRQA